MGKVLYFDCFSGASGDMVLGALVDLGVPLDGLRAALAPLMPPGSDISATRVARSGIGAIQFEVREGRHEHEHQHEHEHKHEHEPGGHARHRGLREILELVARAGLPERVASRASLLFERLGRVEAEIHQVPVERVHFHEVGALDSIVDIVGSVWAIDALGVDRVSASPLNTGSGTVATAHGQLPVPAPATLRLLEGAPAYSNGVQGELVTPTGALLVTGHATSYGPLPPMTIRRTGYGAGQRQLPGQPNVLRAVLGEDAAQAGHGRILVLECKVTQTESALFSAPFALGWSIAPHERVQPCGERWVSDRFWPVSVLSLRDASQPNVNVRRSRQRKIRAVQVLRQEDRGAMPGAQNCRLYSTPSCLKSCSNGRQTSLAP